MDSSSSAIENKKPKLSVRKQTRFKKQPSSVDIPAAKKKTTNLCLRERTLLNKAYELSTLCDIEVCVIYYGPNGELIKTWTEDQSKVRDMSERFIKLSDVERRKKSTNLSQLLTDKINKEKKKSLEKNDNKFSLKVLEMERSLETRLRILQDKLQSLAVASMTEQNNNFTVNELSSLPINDPLITHQQQWSEQSLTNHHLMSGDVYNSGGFAIDSSNQNQNKFSIFLYDREKDTFTQLSDSASGFDQGLAPYNNLMSTGLLGAQGFGRDVLRSCNNTNIPTQNPLVQPWNQTPFYDPMMFSSYN